MLKLYAGAFQRCGTFKTVTTVTPARGDQQDASTTRFDDEELALVAGHSMTCLQYLLAPGQSPNFHICVPFNPSNAAGGRP